MRCVVGLGNPGKKYEHSHHNLGFFAVDRLAERLDADKPFGKFRSLCFKGVRNGHSYLLLKPQTFMNLSGSSLAEASAFYGLKPGDFLVVSDDLNLPTGFARYREKGGHGGHNGLRDVLRHFGEEGFHRVRIGIGRPGTDKPAADYVLGNVSKKKREILDSVIDRIVEPLIDFIEGRPVQLPVFDRDFP